MRELFEILLFCQASGAVIGVVCVVWGEIAYLRALQDGRIDTAERAHLSVIAHGLRYGMLLLLIATLCLEIVAYLARSVPQPAVTARYWIGTLLALLVIGMTWALSRHQISFALGSALVFSGWWFLFFFLFGLLPPLTFGAAAAVYVVTTVLFSWILWYVRFLVIPRTV